MTVRTFVIGSAATALVSAGIWLLIIFYLAPDQAGSVGFIAFFLSLFLAIASLIGLIGYGIRRLISPEQLPAYTVRTSLRQGILVSAFLGALLLLQLLQLYRWWLTLILLLLSICIELVFLSYDRTQHRRSSSTTE